MIKRGAHKICQLIIGGSAFTFFMLQSCNSHDAHNYGGESSKPAQSTNTNSNPPRQSIQSAPMRESELGMVAEQTGTRTSAASKRVATSPKRTGCLG